MMKKIVTNERGNTTLVIMGLLFATIVVTFIFFDFFSAFAAKRGSQTGADAAALAAANEAHQIYDARLRTEVQQKMDDLRALVNLLVANRIAEHEAEQEELDEEDREEPDVEAIFNSVISTLLSGFNGPMPNDLRQWIRGHDVEVNANRALRFFFTDTEVNWMVCNEITDNLDRVQEAARYYAETNGAEEELRIAFPYNEQFHVYVEVEKKPHLVFFPDMAENGENNVEARASASIKMPRNMTISCN
ncbi:MULTISPECIES: pilus assembly protein TadG-related protein [Bacillaceae]|uniref:pilus assembly protein TadG-related protein n=1 Tax=Bacillaceae TaxID=186817 RepID=UPI00047B917D|nr:MULTISPECIES: pilus assembly protein TadG-related protein [Bacillaceae]UOE92258.1 pilus assembly protein TadG-related protein [Alkalihalobacillus sp. LMS39]